MTQMDDGRPGGLSSCGSNPAVSTVPASIPDAGTFMVGRYSDGSAPVIRVRYDVTDEHLPGDVWLDAGDYSGSYFSFAAKHAADLCRAIMTAARAIEAHRDAPTILSDLIASTADQYTENNDAETC